MKPILIALCIAGLLATTALGNTPLRPIFLLLSTSAGLGAALIHAFQRIGKDKYDLAKLAEVDRNAQRQKIESVLEEIDSAGNAICLTCGTHFDPAIVYCPRCGRSIYP